MYTKVSVGWSDPIGSFLVTRRSLLVTHLAVCVAVTVPLTVDPCAKHRLSTSLTAFAGAEPRNVGDPLALTQFTQLTNSSYSGWEQSGDSAAVVFPPDP
jgi:hypothetical protein